jgi:hypothetical protein
MSSSVSTVSAEEIAKQSPALTITKCFYKDKLPMYRLLVPMVNRCSIRYCSWSKYYRWFSRSDICCRWCVRWRSEASALSANDIESVSVLKMELLLQSMEYVENGVIVITTKKGKNAKAKFS